MLEESIVKILGYGIFWSRPSRQGFSGKGTQFAPEI